MNISKRLIPGIDPDHQHAYLSEDYEKFRSQYATSSVDSQGRVSPGIIVVVESIDEIQIAIKYAEDNEIAVAVRTGGHQYEGASSTTVDNIQLDLRQSFRKVSKIPNDQDDQWFFEKDGKAYVRTSVSWNLIEFNTFLGKHKVFVPHGQCAYVGLGGHVQTGGYGQLGRSFGLLGDHVTKLEIVDHHGDIKDNVTKDSDEELFFALLGGSPGNLGVITHFTIEVHRDSDYNFSSPDVKPLGMKSFYWYKPSTLKLLLDKVAQMSEDEDFPRNYDLCITVLSGRNLLGVDTEKKEHHHDGNTPGLNFWPAVWPRMIVVYAQWVPFAKTDDLQKALNWFKQLKGPEEDLFYGHLEPIAASVSVLTAMWIFPFEREFAHPYIKRTYLTKSVTLGKPTSLDKDGWASWVSKRVDELVAPDGNSIWVSVQIQCFGGKNSKFVTNFDNGTSYSWRDSTVVCVLDGFYGTDLAQATVKQWQEDNDKALIGEGGIFSEDDRRVLWGSYGNFDLNAVWEYYYETEEKYHRLGRARHAADPKGVFTPNTFCVKSRVDNE